MLAVAVLAGIGGVALGLVAGWITAWLQIRPWDGSNRDYAARVSKLPYPIFAFGVLSRQLGQWLIDAHLPAPMRVIELASKFLSCQVLYAVVELGIPEVLQGGPMTASELAAATGVAQAEWLDRVMRAAAALGIVSQRPRRQQQQQLKAKSKTTSTTNGATSAKQQLSWGGGDQVLEYAANAQTAVLCRNHASTVRAMVQLYRYNYTSASQLTQALRSGTISHDLAHGGLGFWQQLASDTDKGAVFDEAMGSFKDLGGSSVIAGYAWGRYDTVIDIAGGSGSFLAALLAAHPGIKKGLVVDQKEQVERGVAHWRDALPDLLPRAAFREGDMFAAGSLPPPPPGSQHTAYVLRNVLHNWPDADALKTLRSIRAAMGADKPSSCRLVIVELTSSAEDLSGLLEPRVMADICMLCLFGGGKERTRAQFEALLGAAGFRLVRCVPTVGLLMVLEAEPI